MSSNRQLRRKIQRDSLKNERLFDKTKLLKTAKSILLVLIVLFATVFSLTFYSVYRHNSIREAINQNPRQINGTVVSISTGKGAHVASYEFKIENKKYIGNTLTEYKGQLNDSICVTYLIENPESNIYCYDMEMESWVNDSLITSLQLIGIAIGFTLLILLWKYFTGDKKLIAELTSRKNYR